MAWTRFNIMVFIQVLLIALVGMLVLISFSREFMRMTSVGLILVWLGQIVFLNVYMNRIHRDVRRFMDALKNQDTTQFFQGQKQGSYFSQLYNSFNEISRNFRLVRIEKEVENQFFRETIRQSASGTMAVNEDGQVRLINDAGLQILGLKSLQNLSELRETHPSLAAQLSSPGTKDHFQVKILVHNALVQLAVKSREMNLKGKPVRIFSLLDITREMDRNEVEAWQKLIRVLNHEITNSVTPIHLLSTSLLELFYQDGQQKSQKQIDVAMIDQMVLGLQTIAKRSDSLSDFLNTYKSFTKTSEAAYSKFSLEDLLKRMLSLLAGELEKAGVELTMEISPPELEILADEKLIEQTLINLVKNSIFATEGVEQPLIRIRAVEENKLLSIKVTDNGKGIPEEILDNIFTPFFTTRKEGSGIGLSLARQVLQMHNGTIRVNSKPGEQTTFTLLF